MFSAFHEVFTFETALYFGKGALISLGMAILSLFLGLILGILGASAKRSKYRLLRWIGNIYVEVIRGTPMLLQILIIFSVIPSIYTAITGEVLRINVYLIGIIAMSINSGAYSTELIRSGINGVDKGQWEMENYGDINYVDRVSCKEIIIYENNASRSFPVDTPVDEINCQLSIDNCQSRKRVVLLDCGVKANIIRSLLNRNLTVVRVPWNYDFNGLDYDGLFLSNGPGDPDTCEAAVRNIREALQGDRPICGICMGNQLLAKAGGATIYKLKYGHRSHNQPVRMVGTERCFITSQNHGYAVDEKTLGADWEPLFVNMNDGTNEGIRHRTKPFFSSQFHPEACGGPLDTDFIFDKFTALL